MKESQTFDVEMAQDLERLESWLEMGWNRANVPVDFERYFEQLRLPIKIAYLEGAARECERAAATDRRVSRVGYWVFFLNGLACGCVVSGLIRAIWNQ